MRVLNNLICIWQGMCGRHFNIICCLHAFKDLLTVSMFCFMHFSFRKLKKDMTPKLACTSSRRSRDTTKNDLSVRWHLFERSANLDTVEACATQDHLSVNVTIECAWFINSPPMGATNNPCSHLID